MSDFSELPGDTIANIAGFLVDNDGGDIACFRSVCSRFRASAPAILKR